ncbi:MAG: ribosomal protein L10P, partial [Microgenomates group bacterium LiPW_31]
MVPQRKIFTVQNLAEKLKQAKAFVLTDYSGLDVAQINELRREVKKSGGEFEVVKNTLLRLAAKTGLPRIRQLTDLQGPTAALWLYSEDLTPLKALSNFIQKTELPKVKFGFWQGELISIERIKELMTLPSLAELQAKLINTLKSPTFGLVNSLNWNIQKLVFILKAKGGE